MRVLARGIKKHGKPIAFEFDGKKLEGIEGDSIASALINCGVHGFRGTEGGEKRGLFCGMGVCNECLVNVNGDQGLLACMTALTPSMNIITQPQQISKPDYNQIDPQQSRAEIELQAEFLVIGAGPAGMSVATKLAQSGVTVLVVDERKALGGQYFKQPSSSFAVNESQLDSQYRKGRALMQKFDQSGAKILLGVKIWAADSPEYFLAYDENKKYVLKPNKVVIATGAFERGLAFPGWTLPGVMTTGAGQSLLRSYQVAPGNCVAIAGNGPLNLQLAAELIRTGAKVSVIAESSKVLRPKNLMRGIGLFLLSPKIALTGAGYIFTILKAKTKILTGQVVIQASGTENISQVNFAPIDSKGNPSTKSEEITSFAVDSLTTGYGFMPSNEIARMLGCAHKIDKRWHYLTTTRNLIGATNLANVWVIGDGSGINGAQVAKSNGDLLALELLRQRGEKQSLPKILRRRIAYLRLINQLSFQRILWQIFKAPILLDQVATEETNICRCLSITLAQTRLAITEDTITAGAAKRINRVGMGRCQGRYCSPIIQKLVADNSGVQIDEFAGFAPQIPIKPVEIGVIARSERNLS